MLWRRFKVRLKICRDRVLLIVYHVQDELQADFEDFGLDLPAFNGDDSFDLPVPATYVVDTSGMIRLAFVDPDYTRRLDPTDVLSVLQTLLKAA